MTEENQDISRGVLYIEWQAIRQEEWPDMRQEEYQHIKQDKYMDR